MSVIILLLIASLSVALLFLGLFIWGARHRQFDDDYAPPMRILFDDKPVNAESTIDPKSTIQ
jgi:cbb3-type cytochrome oxidase maturation protein